MKTYRLSIALLSAVTAQVCWANIALAQTNDAGVSTDMDATNNQQTAFDAFVQGDVSEFDSSVGSTQTQQPVPDVLVTTPSQGESNTEQQQSSEPQNGRTPRQEPPVRESHIVQVVGSRSSALERVPGSVTLVRREDIQHMAPQNAGDILRSVPSLNVTSEDGMGLRLNIGIRGLDPNRSRKVLILEDGVPITLNPYGSPELYYSPAIEHVDRIEVVRGSGQILWGPQTIGGVINYITRLPPRTTTVNLEARYGSYGYFLANGSVGSTHGPFGWRLDVIHRRFDGPRRLDLSMTDISGRLRFEISRQSSLGLRLHFYDEASRATYLGLTTQQFNLQPTINLAEFDRFLVRRYALTLTHQYFSDNDLQIITNFYAYQTNRAWRRQEFDRTDMGLDYERICDGSGRCGPRGTNGVTPTNQGDSVFFRRTTAIRNRVFHNVGIESRLTWRWEHGRVVSGELGGVVRFHHESAREQILIGTSPTVESGDPHDEEVRNGYAFSAAVQHRFSFWNRLHVIPGVRLETFWSNRRIVRAPVTAPDGTVRGSDVDVFGSAFSWALIPGIGLSLVLARPVTLYAGLHRGYAPPRTRDAVSASGVNLQLDSELSWNSELGVRVRAGRWLTADVAAFLLEFENQIIPPSEAGGAVSGGTFNSGHSRHFGTEASVTFDLAPLVQARGQTFSLPLTVNYTWLPIASFVGGLYDGNRLPYAPDHQVYAQLRFVHQIGLSMQVGLNFVSSQFTNKENTPFPSPDGLVGEMPSYTTLDMRVAYTFRPLGMTFSLTGRNLTNQVYIANRAPQGIQPNGFLQVFAGVEWSWPRPE